MIQVKNFATYFDILIYASFIMAVTSCYLLTQAKNSFYNKVIIVGTRWAPCSFIPQSERSLLHKIIQRRLFQPIISLQFAFNWRGNCWLR